MAGQVGLSQALSYARDLKSLYETSRARERDLEPVRFALGHREHLTDDLIDVEPASLRRPLPRQRANSPDDVARALAVPDDIASLLQELTAAPQQRAVLSRPI